MPRNDMIFQIMCNLNNVHFVDMGRFTMSMMMWSGKAPLGHPQVLLFILGNEHAWMKVKTVHIGS